MGQAAALASLVRPSFPAKRSRGTWVYKVGCNVDSSPLIEGALRGDQHRQGPSTPGTRGTININVTTAENGGQMPVAIVMDFPGATLDQYDQVPVNMGRPSGGPTPPGALFHWVAS